MVRGAVFIAPAAAGIAPAARKIHSCALEKPFVF
jgi:hypothetical protein